MQVLFARQPIFDREGQVVAYELLYRSVEHQDRAVGSSGEEMASRVIVDAILGMGVGVAADGCDAYLNMPRDFLLDGIIELLDPDAVVIEILETVTPDGEVAEACAKLRASGYRLALDDYVADDPRSVLVPLADIVKVDLLGTPAELWASLVEQVRRDSTRRVLLLAEKVEDEAVRDRCAELGFDLFQGYFFRRPELVQGQDLSPDRVRMLELLNLLRDPAIPQARVVDAFRADPGLTYKLLRMANAAAVGSREVASIPHAIGLLGRHALYRWLALVVAATVGRASGTRWELLREALVRARFAEAVAGKASGRGDPGEAFLVGLFSRMDALLGISIEDLLRKVQLAEDARRALLEGTGALAWVLELAEAQEQGDWPELLRISSAAGLDPQTVAAAYVDALAWMRQCLQGIEE